MKKFFLLLLILQVLPAPAGTATISWVAPTAYTDGKPITEPLTYKVYGGQQGQSKTVVGTVTSSPFTFTTTVSGHSWCFQVTANTALESTLSTEACKLIQDAAPPPVPPNPPTNVTVAVVFGINMSPVLPIAADGTRGNTMLGFVPVNTPCPGPVAFNYRGKAWRKTDPAMPVKWWPASSATTNAAVPCS